MQLRVARAVLIGNLSNSWTPGHQRIEPTLPISDRSGIDSGGDATRAASAVDVSHNSRAGVSTSIDLTPGELHYTARPLDLGIGGMGFFVVQQNDRTFYTRAGRFTLDDERRLVLANVPAHAVLQPEIILPPDATDITIDQYGSVAAGNSDSREMVVIGQINLALFIDPTALIPAAGSLYSASERSGPASIDQPSRGNRGLLSQYHLEASNASFESEMARIRQIDELINLLSD